MSVCVASGGFCFLWFLLVLFVLLVRFVRLASSLDDYKRIIQIIIPPLPFLGRPCEAMCTRPSLYSCARRSVIRTSCINDPSEHQPTLRHRDIETGDGLFVGGRQNPPFLYALRDPREFPTGWRGVLFYFLSITLFVSHPGLCWSLPPLFSPVCVARRICRSP